MYALIIYLLGFLTALGHKNDKRENIDSKTDRGTYKPLPDRPITVVCIPPTLSDEDRAKQKKTNRRESVKFWLEIGGVIVLSVYTGFTVLTWWQVKKSTDAATVAANAAIHQVQEMQAARQPWVGIEEESFRIPQAPTFWWANNSVKVPLIMMGTASYAIKNFGNGPAFHEADAVTAIADFDVVRPRSDADMQFLCEGREVKSKADQGSAVLPGAKLQSGWGTTLLWAKNHHPQDGSNVQIGMIWYLVCVVYQDERKQIHHSKYWFISKFPGTEKPVTIPGHPQWSYLPSTGWNLFDAESD